MSEEKKELSDKKAEGFIPGTDAWVQNILNNTDWPDYWERVAKRVDKGVDAYELARVRSLADASRTFLR